MGTNGSSYERELKGILSGDDETLRKVVRTCAPDEAAAYLEVARRPFLVVRGAGSLGVDLVALRGDISFPIEVKCATADVIRFSDGSSRNMEQAVAMAGECARAGVLPLYAYRRKNQRGDAWRVFTLPLPAGAEVQGRARVVYDRLPKVSSTAGGSYVLRWEEGLPLSRFLRYLALTAGPVTVSVPQVGA